MLIVPQGLSWACAKYSQMPYWFGDIGVDRQSNCSLGHHTSVSQDFDFFFFEVQ